MNKYLFIFTLIINSLVFSPAFSVEIKDSSAYYSPEFITPVQPKKGEKLLIVLKKLEKGKTSQFRTRLTASILCVTLGPFGVHRLYLGTSPIVPAVYVATVGGAVGILPFIDLMAIIFTKDLTPYINNKQIFMWAGEK